MNPDRNFDVVVIGAGVFGAWTALLLKRSGADVLLVDSYGPGNSRASSGGESRIIRMGYGPDEIYTRMAQRSLEMWQRLFDEIGRAQLFQRTGVLWLARDSDPYCEATLESFGRCNVKHERLNRSELLRSYPALEPGPATWGVLEPESGVLMARQAVKAVVDQARAEGVSYREEAVIPPKHDTTDLKGTTPDFLHTNSGNRIRGRVFIFACGPWLPKLFPEVLGDRIHVTRQEVLFFGTPAGWGSMPAWIDFNDLAYAIPNLEHRGFKIAIDQHGPPFDPDTGERTVTSEGIAAVRVYLAGRIPSLSNAPVTETRVCQYENTSNGDFLIDRHPDLANVWFVGGGSGHGFKHGPAVGEYVAGLISDKGSAASRFSLATKGSGQQRQVY